MGRPLGGFFFCAAGSLRVQPTFARRGASGVGLAWPKDVNDVVGPGTCAFCSVCRKELVAGVNEVTSSPRARPTKPQQIRCRGGRDCPHSRLRRGCGQRLGKESRPVQVNSNEFAAAVAGGEKRTTTAAGSRLTVRELLTFASQNEAMSSPSLYSAVSTAAARVELSA